jgi:predicted lysophospholipase L1 biosynthesis ABC-type transport system permease subunit
VVSEGVARRFWPGQNPVGKRVGLGAKNPEDWWTVVGLVAETRYRAMREPAPTVYLPYRQFGGAIMMASTVVVRTIGAPSSATPSIRQAIHETDPDVVVTTAEPVTQLLARQLLQPRLSAMLTGAFGGAASLLSGAGLYAVLAHGVRQRRRELGIRQALGATPSRVRALVLSQAIAMASAGLGWGLLASLGAGQLLRSYLFGVNPTDPLTLAGVVALLLAVALAASYFPARHATSADPAGVLHEN